MFCAATRTGLLRAASITVGSSTGEGHTTISVSLCLPISGANAFMKAVASSGVLYIFQLAAISILRIEIPLFQGPPSDRRDDVFVVREMNVAFTEMHRVAERYFSDSAATPGSSLPSRNSRLAPPPVEMCEMRSATPAACTAATESPP